MGQRLCIDRQSESRAGGAGGSGIATAAGLCIEFRDKGAGVPELRFQNFEVGVCLSSRQKQLEEKRHAPSARRQAA